MQNATSGSLQGLVCRTQRPCGKHQQTEKARAVDVEDKGASQGIGGWCGEAGESAVRGSGGGADYKEELELETVYVGLLVFSTNLRDLGFVRVFQRSLGAAYFLCPDNKSQHTSRERCFSCEETLPRDQRIEHNFLSQVFLQWGSGSSKTDD